jgi:predicted dehydrogenase
MVAVCDPVPAHRERAKQINDQRYGNNDCTAYADFREMLVRDDIDAILCGTPDHWHAIIVIESCKHGKDIYCEKPECVTIQEGRAMVEAARRYRRVVSGGSQRVLGDYGDLPRQVRGGGAGEITEVFVSCGGPSGDCYLPEEPLPPGLDWDLWLGPAPWRPFHSNLIRGGFRPYRDYSGGGMTDWGAHRFGAATFAVGVHKTGPVEVIPPDGKDVKLLTYVYANGMKMYHGGTNNITYRGTEGELPGKGRPVTGPVDIEGYAGRGGIFGDFLECVRTRQKPFRDIEVAHRATTVCHLGNIAYWLKRPLRWDPDKEQIIGDPEANRWLARPMREPWTL